MFLDRGGTGINRGGTADLTLDATLQSIAEAELAKQVEKTHADGRRRGDDGPEDRRDPGAGQRAQPSTRTLLDASAPTTRRNRVVTDLFEPGSTMKPFVVAAAMDAGLVTPDDTFVCENGR